MEIRYKGKYGMVTETVKYNEVNLPNLLETKIYTGDHLPKVDEEVYLTSCDIPYYNNWEDCWVTRPDSSDIFADVVLELIDYDDSNYEPSQSRNGGKYLESRWTIKEIKNISTFEEI